MKHVARSWADDTDDQLDQFDFVFCVSLQGKDVEKLTNIENIIISQHSGLKVHGVLPEEIKSILHEETTGKVLLLVDGLDHDGMNNDIDEAAQKMGLWKCWMMVTSRNSREALRQYMDAEVELCGIDEAHVKEYVKKFVHGEQRIEGVLKQVKEIFLNPKDTFGQCSQFYTSMFLNMIGTFYTKHANEIPKRARILQAILDGILDREAVRNTGETASEKVKELATTLGKLVWEGLNDPDGIRQVFKEFISVNVNVGHVTGIALNKNQNFIFKFSCT